MVAECFNDFFINVAKDIGSETAADKNHPSIIEINKNKPSPTKLRRDIVTLPSVRPSFRPSFRNILVTTLESTSFNGFLPNSVLSRVWNPIDFQGHRVKFLISLKDV
jgi:hypothetical protein